MMKSVYMVLLWMTISCHNPKTESKISNPIKAPVDEEEIGLISHDHDRTSAIEEDTIALESDFSSIKNNTTKDPDPVVKKPTQTIKNVVNNPKNDQEDNKPKLMGTPVFEEVEYDFGTIVEGEVISHRFVFKNSGPKELNIKKAIPSCGCTAPSFPFIGIASGEEGFIGVEYNSIGKEGQQIAEIKVITDGMPVEVTLYLKGQVTVKENP